jgi:hypothetical protein
MQNREEVIGAAMLAKMVGSHLVGVDQLTVEKSNSGGFANKINMNNFIAPLQGKSVTPNYGQQMGASPDVVKAYQGLNELALQSIPEVGQPIPMTNMSVQQPESNIQAGSPVMYQPQPKTIIKEESSIQITRSDIDSIRNSLKGIDKSLVAIVKYLENSKPKKNV